MIKNGRDIDQGDIATLRNLAGYRISATLPDGSAFYRELGGDEVNETLAGLIAQRASNISVAPASLEETFIGHYSTEAPIMGANQ
ncbi:hypothetical protein [Corynebacterium epidermidicanis]|uniref:hypothetical protein n=1 Tax=Corynebacterium epidermidicanis TaxID=1050174 RepID=UPI001F2EE4B6|nr:hypothetical protein [Corynebacterium epidermidicanis]